MSHVSKSRAKGISASSFFDLKAELSKQEADFAKAKAAGGSTKIIGGVKRPDKVKYPFFPELYCETDGTVCRNRQYGRARIKASRRVQAATWSWKKSVNLHLIQPERCLRGRQKFMKSSGKAKLEA
jgi:hypothetical protein